MRLHRRPPDPELQRGVLAVFIHRALAPQIWWSTSRYLYRLPIRRAVLERCGDALLQLAALFEDRSVRVDPGVVRDTERFLTHAADSPLYGDHPIRALHAIVDLINRVEHDQAPASTLDEEDRA
jgi:hypothetical protein